MPPTLKDSLALGNSTENEERLAGPSSSEGSSSAQPVALEVPITINGARAVEGSSKREPFSESTNTVLVLANGAVIRLASAVAAGQLLFLTNEKSKKEVVCQVVKSKNARSASGYVELEFTEPVLGFWGMRFPGEWAGQANASLPTARKAEIVAPTRTVPVAPVESKTESSAAVTPVAKVTAKPNDVEEFKTDIKADLRPSSKADFLAPPDATIDGLKLEANRMQEQLSALLFAEEKPSENKPASAAESVSKQELGDAAAKIFDMATAEPVDVKKETVVAKADQNVLPSAVAKSTSGPSATSFEDEEVKIPAWLEPLARSAAITTPAAEQSSNTSFEIEERHATPTSEIVSAPKRPAATALDTNPRPKHGSTAAVFGNSLLGESAVLAEQPRGSNKGMWIGAAAGLLLVAGGGAWYFRDALQSGSVGHLASVASVPATATPRAVAPQVSSVAAPTPSAAVDPANPATRSNANNAPMETSGLGPAAVQGKVQPAAMTERVPKPTSNSIAANSAAKMIETVEPEIKKPSLGKVRLAKPKVGHSSVQANSEIEPALEIGGGTVPSDESSLGAGFAENSKQPTAPAMPIPVGGDVRPARMISSVPPAYPLLAKSQHIAGDVRIDALIDANGRVTTMKVVAGPSLLHQAAMDSLRQWKYQAASLDGKAVPMHLTVTIQFRLQ